MAVPKVADYKRPTKHQKKKVKSNDKEEEDTNVGVWRKRKGAGPPKVAGF